MVLKGNTTTLPIVQAKHIIPRKFKSMIENPRKIIMTEKYAIGEPNVYAQKT